MPQKSRPLNNISEIKDELKPSNNDVDDICIEDISDIFNHVEKRLYTAHDVHSITTTTTMSTTGRHKSPKTRERKGRFAGYNVKPGRRKRLKNTNMTLKLYQKQKSESRVTHNVRCLCCSLKPSCVGIIGGVLLLGLCATLLSFRGEGRRLQTVNVRFENETRFREHFSNDSYNYTFKVVKHIRSYMRCALLRKPGISRTYVSISHLLGYFDDYLVKLSGTTKLLFDRLPYESFFRRDATKSAYFRLIHRYGIGFKTNVSPALSNIRISLPPGRARRFLVNFNDYFGYGHVSVPPHMINNYISDQQHDYSAMDQAMILMPANDEFIPK